MRFPILASARLTMCALGCVLFARAACAGVDGRPIQVPLRPYAQSDLRTVAVRVVGRESPFIFDTGAGDTVLTPQMIRHAGCTPFGRVIGFRATGGQVTSSRCGPVALQIGSYRVDRDVLVFDLLKLLGKVPPVGGILGLGSFDGQAITIDLAHNRLTIETARSLARRIRTMRPINVRVTLDASGAVVPFIQVRAKTGTLWLEVDSGNNGPVFLAPHAQKQLGISIPQHVTRPLDLDVIGLGRVPVKVASRKLIYDGQLDPAFLRQMEFTLDLAHDRAWARMNTP